QISALNDAPHDPHSVPTRRSSDLGVTFVSATGGTTPVNGLLSFNLGTIPYQSNSTVEVVVTPTTGAALTTTASVSAVEEDPDPTSEEHTSALQSRREVVWRLLPDD